MQNEKEKSKTAKKTEKSKYLEDLIKETEEDFYERQKDRLSYEREWELNMNFLVGNQYCDLSSRGDLIDESPEYFWQKKEVFNHIAPVIETRLARFSRVNPVISVRPKTDDDSDVKGASVAEKLLSSYSEKNDLISIVKKTTVWSETCGTGFYKITWDNDGGSEVGEINSKKVYEGEAKVTSVSPFEIFPDSLYNEKLEDCFSIIHAKAIPVKEVYEKYGVKLQGEEVGVYSLTGKNGRNFSEIKDTLKDSVVVIEKYERPSKEFPKGRLITVAGGKLLYYGDLPYKNGDNGGRTFPFVKQENIQIAGCFFGESIIKRLIPVQRAFNAVKNRKHEFINRLSTGIMKVEDGSVDIDDLQSEGLPPGKILVYRQGSNSPEMMDNLAMPTEFSDEEDKLLNEFVAISGVSEVSSSMSTAKITGATALSILVEQDNEKLIVPAEKIRRCCLDIAKHVLRLYSQFSVGVRLIKFKDTFNKTKVVYVNKNSINSDEVYLENENELMYSNASKKEMIFKLYESGLLFDEKGALRPSTKEKILSLLGYKDLDYQKGVAMMQEEKAQSENPMIREKGLNTEEVDDDAIHIDEHTRYILSEYTELDEEEKARLFAHLKEHKEKMNQNKTIKETE